MSGDRVVGLHEWRLGTDCVVTVMTAPSLLVQVNDCRHFNPVEDAHLGRVKPVRVQNLEATQWGTGLTGKSARHQSHDTGGDVPRCRDIHDEQRRL